MFKRVFLKTIVYLDQLSSKISKPKNHFAKLKLLFGYNEGVIWGFWDNHISPLLENEDSKVNNIGI